MTPMRPRVRCESGLAPHLAGRNHEFHECQEFALTCLSLTDDEFRSSADGGDLHDGIHDGWGWRRGGQAPQRVPNAPDETTEITTITETGDAPAGATSRGSGAKPTSPKGEAALMAARKGRRTGTARVWQAGRPRGTYEPRWLGDASLHQWPPRPAGPWRSIPPTRRLASVERSAPAGRRRNPARGCPTGPLD